MAGYRQDRYNPFVQWNSNGGFDWITASRAEKEDWFEQCASLDITDQHDYVPGEWSCVHFTIQTYLNFGGHDAAIPPLYSDPTWSTPNRFNLPLYYVSVLGPSFDHFINGILVGGNPLDIDDWYFFEPQTDQHVYPGDSSMPGRTEIGIRFVGEFWGDAVLFTDRTRLVHWHIEDDLTPLLLGHHEDLVLPLAGDANLDAVVDVLDLTTLANNFNRTPADWEHADFNDDDIVDVLDLTIFANNFGSTTGAKETPIPEPAALALLGLGGLAVIRRRRP